VGFYISVLLSIIRIAIAVPLDAASAGFRNLHCAIAVKAVG
jgi:hypothetical protein